MELTSRAEREAVTQLTKSLYVRKCHREKLNIIGIETDTCRIG